MVGATGGEHSKQCARMKRKICIVTATRAEYGLLRWLMQDIKNDPELELQLIVTGAHLSAAHGFTYDEILKDGLEADELIEIPLEQTDKLSLVKAMAVCLSGMGSALERLCPDIMVVLGDRYELLPICSAAVVLNIPIAHISGGDITEGAIDEQIRHAVSKMAYLHFPGTEDSAKRIVQMGEDPARVFAVGEPGLDAFLRINPPLCSEVANELGLDEKADWILLTYHPETMSNPKTDQERVRNILNFLSEQENIQIVATGANADHGGQEINALLQDAAKEMPDKVRFFMSLGQRRYIGFLHHAACVVGNSSSGIIETPVLKVPVLNIGDRQKGRFMSRNIVCCEATIAGLENAYARIKEKDFLSGLQDTEAYYGDGHTTERIIQYLKDIDLGLLLKPFVEL